MSEPEVKFPIGSKVTPIRGWFAKTVGEVIATRVDYPSKRCYLVLFPPDWFNTDGLRVPFYENKLKVVKS